MDLLLPEPLGPLSSRRKNAEHCNTYSLLHIWNIKIFKVQHSKCVQYSLKIETSEHCPTKPVLSRSESPWWLFTSWTGAELLVYQLPGQVAKVNWSSNLINPVIIMFEYRVSQKKCNIFCGGVLHAGPVPQCPIFWEQAPSADTWRVFMCSTNVPFL